MSSTFDIADLMLQHANGRPLRDILIQAHAAGHESVDGRCTRAESYSSCGCGSDNCQE